MIHLSGIIATDEINRYNEKITLGAMINAYFRQWMDIMPFTYNHDSTKLIGYSKLSGVYIEPRKSLVTNTSYVAENEHDYGIVTRLLSHTISRNIPPEYDQLKEKLADLIVGKSNPVIRGSVAVHNKGIVIRKFPSLLSQCDQDGLIDLAILKSVQPGVYQLGEYLVYAHSYFRRSLSRLNSLNTPFLEAFERAKESLPTCKLKIKLDLDLLGLAGTQAATREYAYWWGPKFSDDLSAIPTGLTRFENENYNSFSSPIRFTECGWYIQDDRRTFECEEVTETENITDSDEGLYGCRYVHSMLTPSTGEVSHLDGAIRAYTLEKILDRLETKMTDSSRDTVYTKLWRIDGSIPVTLWKSLITHYYRDNHLIGEYFDGTDSNNVQSMGTADDGDYDATFSRLREYIPVNLVEEDGVHIFISGKELEEFSTYDAKLYPLKDTIPSKSPHIELMSETLFKYLKQQDLNVRMPFCPKYYYCRDMNINLSTVLCRNVQIANKVMECIRNLCFQWSEEKHDRLLSFAVGVNYDECCAIISFCGHVYALRRCFESGKLVLPETISDFVPWAEQIYSFQQKMFHASTDQKVSDIVLSSGRVGIRHRPIIEEGQLASDEVGISYSYKVSKETSEDISLFGLSGTLCASVEEELCSKCNQQYASCNCIKVIEPECTTIITKASPQGMYWINRSADIENESN